jgi:vanillate O-demethylase monooxygenase subunit
VIRNTWYVVGLSRSFHYAPAKKIVTGLPIVMWRRREGPVVAFDARCTHKRFPLWDGKLLDNGSIQCPYHGLCFDHTGKCVDIPSQPDVPISPSMHLRDYPVIEQDGIVWLWPGEVEKSKSVKPPRIPELSDPKYDSAVSDPPIRVRAEPRLLIENLLDITHFFPLHDGNIGDRANSLIPVELSEGVVDGNPVVKTSRSVKNYMLTPYYQRWFQIGLSDRIATHAMMGPGLVRAELRVAPAGQLGTEAERGFILCHSGTPTEKDHLEWHWFMITRAGLRFPPDTTMTLAQGLATENLSVIAQDIWALTRQQEMLDLPDDLGNGNRYREMNLRADVGVLKARQTLSRMAKSEDAAA